jgi:hypothetical protein
LFLDITGLLAFLLLRRAVPHAQIQSVLAFVAIKPVCSFDACSAQHNYGRDLALHFFERVGFSMNPPRKWTTRFKYAELQHANEGRGCAKNPAKGAKRLGSGTVPGTWYLPTLNPYRKKTVEKPVKNQNRFLKTLFVVKATSRWFCLPKVY